MPTYISEKFVVVDGQDEYEIFVNSDQNVFVGEPDINLQQWFTLTREEWEDLKKFIDNQFA